MTSQYMTHEAAEEFLSGLQVEQIERLPEPWVGNKVTVEGVNIYIEHTTVRGLPRVLVSLEDAEDELNEVDKHINDWLDNGWSD